MSRQTSMLFALATLLVAGCDSDKDGISNGDDCAPDNADIHPDAEEICDGIDNNCDGNVDEGVTLTFFADADADGYGDANFTLDACELPAGFVEDDTDCNDLNAAANPDAGEVCDDVDNDCDGLVDGDDDSNDATTGRTFYQDLDSDGYGDDLIVEEACSTPDGYAELGGDCDDVDAELNPDTQWFSDQDDDSYGHDLIYTNQCEQPDGYVRIPGDCDDGNSAINPDAEEICDGNIDNNCDGLADDLDPNVNAEGYVDWFLDTDGDGYGEETVSINQCNPDSGYVAEGTDCDETNTEVNPGMEEVCEDGLDNNCDGGPGDCAVYGDYEMNDAAITLSGDQTYEYFGRAMATPDINGDGKADLVVGGYGWDDTSAGNYATGRTQVWYGPVTSGSSPDFSVNGTTYNNYFGSHIADVGDVNNDGYDDVLVGAYYRRDQDGTGSYGVGAAYLYYGSGTAISGDYDNDDFVGMFIEGEDSYDYFGGMVAGYGDLDGDGYDDFGIGAYGNDDGANSAGVLYLYYGAASGLEGEGDYDDFYSAKFTGNSTYAYMGYYSDSSTAGDMNGDGEPDLVVTQPYGSSSNVGRAYIMYGTGTALSGSYTVDDTDAEIGGTATYDYFGLSVAFADLDDDGYDELLASEYQYNGGYGAVYVFGGSPTDLSGSYTASGDSAWSITGASSSTYLGYSFGTGDVDSDGTLDLNIGARGEDSYTGASYLFTGPFSASITTDDAVAKVVGDDTYTYTGQYDSQFADLNDDGHDDLVGSSYYGNGDLGQVYILTGGSM